MRGIIYLKMKDDAMRMKTLWVSTIRAGWIKVNTGGLRLPGGLAAARPGMLI